MLTIILAGKYPAKIDTIITRINLKITEAGSATSTIVAKGVSIGCASIKGFKKRKMIPRARSDPDKT